MPFNDERALMLDPKAPLSRIEVQMYGADAERCAITGHVFERGSGAWPKERQTAEFLRRIELDKHRPRPIDVKEFSRRPLGAPRTDPPWSYDKGDVK